MSAIGLGFQATPRGVRVRIIEQSPDGRNEIGHIDYTAEQAAQVANLLLRAIGGKTTTKGKEEPL